MRKTFSLFAIFMLISAILIVSYVTVNPAKANPDDWVSPDGHVETAEWTSEESAYDEDTLTGAYKIAPFSPIPYTTGFLTLTLSSAIQCNKIRQYIVATNCDWMDIDVYKDDSWVDIYTGNYAGDGNYYEIGFAQGSVSQIRMRFRITVAFTGVSVREVDFWEIEGGDENPPTYSNIGSNASHCREECQFSCLWEDETELSGYVFGWNGTGSFSNDTWTSLSGTSEWANKTKTLPNNDCIVSFRWWCNDTSNNWNTTELQTLNVTDCYIFARFTFNISNPEPNETVFFNGSWSVSSSAITSYEWTFGDGNTDSGATVTHSYSTENTFSITLNVTSSDGSDTFTLNLTVAEGPVAEIQGSSGGLYSLLVHVTWNQVPCSANVTVQNSQGNDSSTGDTDLLGNAKFNLPMGIYFVSTSYRNHTLEETVHLNENSFVSFNFKVKGGPTWIALLAVIIVLVIGYIWIGKKKKTRKHKATLEPRSHKPTTKPRKHEDNLKPRK